MCNFAEYMEFMIMFERGECGPTRFASYQVIGELSLILVLLIPVI